MGYRAQEIRPEVKIHKLLLVESKRYKDMWLRPYEMNVTHEDTNRVENIVARSLHMGRGGTGTNNIQGLVNNEMPNILTPSSMVSGRADIIHGWDEKRFKFVLIVEIKQPQATNSIINYIQGYTEFLGISQSDHIDENMRLYTNSVIKLSRTVDSHTGQVITIPLTSFNVVNDETRQNDSAYDSLKLARPADIAMNVASVKDLDNGVDVISMSNIGSVNGSELVNKSSLLPNDHVSSTIKNAIDSKFANGMIGSDGDVVDSMVGNMMTPSLYHIDFFKTILNIKGQGNDFTIHDLKMIEPDIAHVIEPIMGNAISNINIPHELLTEDTAETYDSSLESRVSLIVHEAVSVILNESVLNNIVFEVDNNNGVPDGQILDAGSYVDGLHIPVYANKFLSMFIQRAWNTISNNNHTIVSVLVMGMVESDTTVVITLDGRPPITYRYPTFADSKFLPIIMDNSRLELMSEDYNQLIDATLGVVNNSLQQASIDSMPYNTPQSGGLFRR